MTLIEKARNFARISGLTAGLIAMGGVGAAYASTSVDVDDWNEETGFNSLNVNRTDVTTEEDLSITNDSWVENLLDVYARTGRNEIRNNTTVDGFTSGSVSLSGAIETTSNDLRGFNLWEDMDLDVDIDAGNDTTGANSENRNTTIVNNSRDVRIRNNSEVTNELNFRANTGDNVVRNNTTVGDVSGGDVNASFDITTHSNTGAASMGLSSGSTDVSVDGGNFTTGANSENVNRVEVNNTSDISIRNDSTITNEVNANVNTGDNTYTGNTTLGDVSTGDVDLDFTITNHSN